MLARAPLTIWRHTTGDLAKLVLMSTAVLVTVISFAGAVKFFAEGKLGPVETLQFTALAIPPMLAYALPFAAGFGATLVYHRVAQDNEHVAARAGGIGYRRLLVPAGMIGIVLALALGLLNDQVNPRLLRSMEDLITAKVANVIVRTIERGEALSFDGRVMVHADAVKLLEPDPGVGASARLLLGGVGAIGLDRHGQVESEVTATRAWVWVVPGGARRVGAAAAYSDEADHRQTAVYIRMENAAVSARGSTSTLGRSPTFMFLVPDQFMDDPKYLTWREMSELREHPERMNFINDRRLNLAYHIAERETTAAVQRSLNDAMSVRLEDASGRPVVVRASAIRWTGTERGWEILPEDGRNRVEVEVYAVTDSGTALARRLSAARASMKTNLFAEPDDLTLSTSGRRFARSLTMDLFLEGVEVSLAESGQRAGSFDSQSIEGVRLAGGSIDHLLAMRTGELLETASRYRRGDQPDEFVADPARDLEQRLHRLDREIASKRHERLAMPAACIVMVLAGAVGALRLQGGSPLGVYLWSFFPALGTVLTISGGQQMYYELGPAGLIVLWGGVAGLGLFTLNALRTLARH